MGTARRRLRLSFGQAATIATGAVCLITLADAETLRATITAGGINPTGLSSPCLDQEITGNCEFSSSSVYLVAYYLKAGNEALGDTLYADKLDKRTGIWIHKEYGCKAHNFERGSIANIAGTKNAFYLYTHLNPSAGTLLILSPSLESLRALPGSFLADFDRGLVVYKNNRVHFAPTHPSEVSIYDSKTRTSRLIYPPKQYQEIRKAHIARVKRAYEQRGEAWFRENNHHGNPEMFTNDILGEVAVNNETDSLAFVAVFDNTEWMTAEDRPKETKVVYVYRNVRDEKNMDYREFLFEDMKQQFGDKSLAEILKQEVLGTIFTQRMIGQK